MCLRSAEIIYLAVAIEGVSRERGCRERGAVAREGLSRERGCRERGTLAKERLPSEQLLELTTLNVRSVEVVSDGRVVSGARYHVSRVQVEDYKNVY